MPKAKNLIGQKIGRLTIISEVPSLNKKYGKYWLCECECGTQKILRGSSIGRSTFSCGCLKKEKDIAKCKTKTKHGMSNTRIYKIWAGIKTRCYNSKNKIYKFYGEKNIKMCKEWESSFEEFYNWAISNGYNDKLSIDRIDYSGDYEPNNCRWATNIEQANNKSFNHFVEINGERHTVAEWSRIYNITGSYIYQRCKRGMNITLAITTPLHKYNKKEVVL